ncbi:MAG: lipopolysaccharide transport periplasmic protein LptA, partial [Thiovulaceae bacterium]|nr:lipopolysaccharide transport periplasmic protein LptA [Sulfurimonadaceae bacterium]
MKIILFFPLFMMFLLADKVNIAAERFYVSQQERMSVFGGNVQIKMNQDELNATKVYVYFDQKNKPLKYQADGNVSFFVKTDDN